MYKFPVCCCLFMLFLPSTTLAVRILCAARRSCHLNPSKWLPVNTFYKQLNPLPPSSSPVHREPPHKMEMTKLPSRSRRSAVQERNTPHGSTKRQTWTWHERAVLYCIRCTVQRRYYCHDRRAQWIRTGCGRVRRESNQFDRQQWNAKMSSQICLAKLNNRISHGNRSSMADFKVLCSAQKKCFRMHFAHGCRCTILLLRFFMNISCGFCAMEWCARVERKMDFPPLPTVHSAAKHWRNYRASTKCRWLELMKVKMSEQTI